MNRLSIELNNMAVEDLKRGRLEKALESISLACLLVSQQYNVHFESDKGTYRFYWHDCTQGATHVPLQLTQSSQAFLYLNFLTISTAASSEATIDLLCPCGFAWAIWYK
jgi:hypothetical protein